MVLVYQSKRWDRKRLVKSLIQDTKHGTKPTRSSAYLIFIMSATHYSSQYSRIKRINHLVQCPTSVLHENADMYTP